MCTLANGTKTCEVAPCGTVEFLRRLPTHQLPTYSEEFTPEPRFEHWRTGR